MTMIDAMTQQFGKVLVSGCSILLLLASGCTKLGPDYKRPDVKIADSWVEKDPKVKQARKPADYSAWWKAFKDPTLNKLIETARNQNLSLQVAGIRVLEARALRGVAVGEQYPQAQSIGGSVNRNIISKNAANSGAPFDTRFTNADIGFDAAWELDFWGRFRRGVEAADAELYASVAGYDDVLVALTAEVAAAYIEIRTAQQRIRITRENVVIQTRALQIASVRFRAGAVTELDMQQARSLLRNTEARIPDLQIRERQAQNRLNVLLGMAPNDLTQMLGTGRPIPNAGSEIGLDMPAELLRRRPDIRRAEIRAAAQSARIGIAQSDLYPQLSLTGSIGLQAASTSFSANGSSDLGDLFDGDSVFGSFGPAFRWNILNYGRIKNRVRAQDARLQSLLVTYQNLVLRAAREVEDGLVSFVRTQERAKFLADSVAASKRSVQLSLIQYRRGTTDFIRVLDTQRVLVDQQDALTAVEGSVALSLVATYKALGGGWQIRKGKDFVPSRVKKTMAARTDWGDMLSREKADKPRPWWKFWDSTGQPDTPDPPK